MCCLAATSGDICGQFKLANIQNDSTAETIENTHTPQLKQRNDLDSQTTSLKETSLQNPEPQRNSSEKMKLVANKYCASITPGTFKMKPKKRLTATQLKCNGDDNICFLTKTTSPLFGKRLWEMRHERAVFIRVLHHSSWKVYLPLDFVNYLITQPIWLGVSSAQYEKIAHKDSIKERIYDIMDRDHDCSYKRVTSWKHQNPSSTRPRSTNYDQRQHLKPNCKEAYRHWIFESVLACSTERLRTISRNPRNVLCNWYGANTYLFLEAPDSSPGTNTMRLLILNGYCWLH